MHKFACCFTLVILATVASALPDPNTRIIGGQAVNIAKHPYLVSIRYKSNENTLIQHRCAGSIYSERVVITSAQCIEEITYYKYVLVVAGANTRTGSDGMPYPVVKWVKHANYSFWTVDYDIGLMFVEIPFGLDGVTLRSISIRKERPAVGKMGTIAGWGYTEEFGPSSYQLEETQVPIISKEDCEHVYGPGEVTERMICAGNLVNGGKDACQGDTGGPLVIEGELVGLVSWGRGCGRRGYPGVYTLVSSLQTWIDENIAKNIN